MSGLRSKLALLYREIAKFGAVGAVGVLVNIGVFNLVRHDTGLQTVRASVVATMVSIVFNYVGFRYFTYRDRDRAGRTRELSLFLLFSAVGLVIENGVLYTATYAFGWDSPLQSNVFKFVGIGVATLFRFWSYRTWVFRALPAHEAVEQAECILAQAEQAQSVRPESVQARPQQARTQRATEQGPAGAGRAQAHGVKVGKQKQAGADRLG